MSKKKVKWITQKQILKKLEISKKSLNKQLINLDLKDSKIKLTTKAIEKEFAKIDCNKIFWNEKIINVLDETMPLGERVDELISLIKKLNKIINNYNKNPENEKLYRFLWEESFDKTERKYLLVKKNKKILGYLLVKLEEYELLNFFDGYIAEKDIELNKILLLKYKLEQTFLKSNKNMNVKI